MLLSIYNGVISTFFALLTSLRRCADSNIRHFAIAFSIVIIVIVIHVPSSHSQTRDANHQFESLQQLLIDYGFNIKQEIPPYQNQYGIKPYGLLDSKTKTIWINPIVFDLGNAEPTLIHESIHAAQLCAGKGKFDLLNLDIEPPKITHPYFMRYHNYRREIEAEAYTVQVQSNSGEIARELLKKHCSVN